MTNSLLTSTASGFVTVKYRNSRILSSIISNLVVLLGSLLVYCMLPMHYHTPIKSDTD